MNLYVKFVEEEGLPESINAFLKRLYEKRDNFQLLKAETTFANKEFTEIQCEAGRRRSFDDLYDLVNTYYPNTTRERLISELLSVKFFVKEKEYFPYLSYCGTINKIIFLPYIQEAEINSGNLTIKMHKSKNTWKELLELINIKANSKDIRDYHKSNKK